MKSWQIFAIVSCLNACAPETIQLENDLGKARYCGESFCISGVRAESVTKLTPVEDFNWYQFDLPIGTVSIYEGNTPDIFSLEKSAIVDLGQIKAWSLSPTETPTILVQGRAGWPTSLVFYLKGESAKTSDLVELLRGLSIL